MGAPGRASAGLQPLKQQENTSIANLATIRGSEKRR
jgi:hypothetical protein